MKNYNQSADICANCRADGIQVDCPVVHSAHRNVPEIIFDPVNENNFKNELLKTKQAQIIWEYADGTIDPKLWKANKVTSSTNIRGNIRSRKQWRLKSQNGLVKVHVKIIYSVNQVT